MPYKRYDIKNKYNRKGRRVNEIVWLNTVLLIVIPIVIVLLIFLGIFLPIKSDSYVVVPETTETTKVVMEEISSENTYDESLLQIVNEKNPLDESFVPSLVKVEDVEVSEVIAQNLNNLIEDAAKDGIHISLKTGYISYSEQGKLHESIKKEIEDSGVTAIKAEALAKEMCPEAGCSEAQTGLLITLSTDEEGDFANTEAGKWLAKYSVNYGFILRYPEGAEEDTGRAYDPATYRFVGIDHAKQMRSLFGMNLEGYVFHIEQHNNPYDY